MKSGKIALLGALMVAGSASQGCLDAMQGTVEAEDSPDGVALMDGGMDTSVEVDAGGQCIEQTRGKIVVKLLKFHKDKGGMCPDNPEIPFSDIPHDHPATEAIGCMFEHGVVSGHSNGRFLPDSSVTRAEYAKILEALIDLPNMVDADIPEEFKFQDVPDHQWYHDFVMNLVLWQIIDAPTPENDKFHPNEIATDCFVDETLERAEDPTPLPTETP